MIQTNAWQKLLPSVLNATFVGLITLPVWFLDFELERIKIIVISTFFLYTILFIFFKNGRDPGMIIFKTYWKRNYHFWQRLIYSVLYTASFSTLFFSFWFSFDLLIFNLFLIQLPCVLISGTTFHGWLSGGIETVVINKKT